MTDEMLAIELRKDTYFLSFIIERYEGKLFLYIKRKSSASHDDIKDILQNVFIKVYKNINNFDETLSFSSWIYRITRNEMIDWYRKEKRTPHLSLEASDTLLQGITSDSDILKSATDKELEAQLKEVIQTLPDKYRDVVILRYFEDKSYDEIADILAMPPGTVAVRINRVKALLREKLQKYGK